MFWLNIDIYIYCSVYMSVWAYSVPCLVFGRVFLQHGNVQKHLKTNLSLSMCNSFVQPHFSMTQQYRKWKSFHTKLCVLTVTYQSLRQCTESGNKPPHFKSIRHMDCLIDGFISSFISACIQIFCHRSVLSVPLSYRFLQS